MDEEKAFAAFMYSIAFFFFSIPVVLLILRIGELSIYFRKMSAIERVVEGAPREIEKMIDKFMKS